MTQDHTVATPGIVSAPPVESSDVLSKIREMLAAADVATVIIGLDGSLIDSNEAGITLFPAQSAVDGRQLLGVVLDQLPQQLLVDPEGGVWKGEIDLAGHRRARRDPRDHGARPP